jgi:hypothetical protein
MSWKSPTWREPANFPYWKKIRSVPAAVSGNLMVFYSIAPSPSPGQDLLLLRFPSELRGIPEQQWSLNLDCDYIHAVCVDDSQDLLCFLSSVFNFEFPSLPAHHLVFSLPDVHVRSLSTGEIHPLTHAVGPIYSLPSEVPAGTFCLQIYDDLLMLVIDFLEHYILVFNWRTGGYVAKIVGFLSILVERRINLPYPSRPSNSRNALSSTELISSFHAVSVIMENTNYGFGLCHYRMLPMMRLCPHTTSSSLP